MLEQMTPVFHCWRVTPPPEPGLPASLQCSFTHSLSNVPMSLSSMAQAILMINTQTDLASGLLRW